MQQTSIRTTAAIAAAVTLLALAVGLLLDGLVLSCNESLPPQCTEFHVAWPALLPVALTTLLLAFAAVRFSPRSRSRRAELLSVSAFVGAVASCILALRVVLLVG